MERRYDLAIIGGGINGCGIARDAAGRGLSVFLCEQDDLASGTSSAATKLIHGGLRYLEYYEFRLVREALMEREVLWKVAPHIIWPLRFVLPHHKGLRPRWMLRLGLLLYDHLGGRKLLPPTRSLNLAVDLAGKPLKPGMFKRGFEYSDCWVDDSRLVALNARDAADRGAVIRTRAKAISAERRTDGWTLTTRDKRDGALHAVEARVLVNAAGPWVGDVRNLLSQRSSTASIRLVQGSHIVVRRLYDHDRCYIFQNADNRIIFAIPYERDFTLIGTTDRDYSGDPAAVSAAAEEIDYLCQSASEYFAVPIVSSDVVWSFSGVRPLFDDGASKAQAATRDYVLELDEEGGAPILSVFGGKITTYRRLAEQALLKLAPHLKESARAIGSWTGRVPLPGGDFPVMGFSALADGLARRHAWLGAADAVRLARSYGSRAGRILDGATDRAALGRDFGAGLSEAEVRHLIREEFAREAEDVLWRRSKLGLRLSAEQVEALRAFMDDELGRGPVGLTKGEGDARRHFV